MGHYLEVPENHNKAQQLIDLHGARDAYIPEQKRIVRFDELDPDTALICVVENPLFDAAAIIFDQREWEDFTDPYDTRPKRWLLMDKNKVNELNPKANL